MFFAAWGCGGTVAVVAVSMFLVEEGVEHW